MKVAQRIRLLNRPDGSVVIFFIRDNQVINSQVIDGRYLSALSEMVFDCMEERELGLVVIA